MVLSENSLILLFINNLKKKHKNLTYNVFTQEIQKEYAPYKKLYDFSIKENDDIFMIYSNNSQYHNTFNNLSFDLENDTKCCIIDNCAGLGLYRI